jgi:phage tail protein X
MRLEDAGKRHLADRRMAAYARVTRAIYALLSANPGLSGTERAA